MVKVISLSDEAYRKLKALKGRKSFSEVVIEMVGKKKEERGMAGFFGKWPGGKEELDAMEEMIESDRKNAKMRDARL